MFRTLLIANRGEIACRIIRTARAMGLRTIAVYSEADTTALHVALADEAHLIGPSPARESYLRIDRIIEAAKRAGAQAIHPGYGFLSENADFAEACAAANIVFIGPPSAAIRAMGSKSAAKALMEKAGVPLVPGYHGANQDPAFLASEAARIGYPVLIKASAGGGGKGMRAVERAADFAEGLASAKGEARASFNDEQVLVERYLARPRHIEIQIVADTHGNTISLFERDCSLQRRHQKVLEEAPAPGIDPARRQAMGEAACAAARAVGYVGAGTVEFIAEGGAFYFMEMNTRLQVEHPVTEFITGLDLVEWQLRVASGEALPPPPAAPNGHAMEARIYAEDPALNYMPSVGTLLHLRAPSENPHVRVDTGVRAGDTITVHYDPMIAKLIVWDTSRAAAARRLQSALAEYEIAGVSTNLDLLRRIVKNEDFLHADLDTGFLARHPNLFPAPAETPPIAALAAAAAHVLEEEAQLGRAALQSRNDPHSPWAAANAWRLNGEGYQDVTFRHADTDHLVRIYPGPPNSFTLETAETRVTVTHGEAERLSIDGIARRASVTRRNETLFVLLEGAEWRLTHKDPLGAEASETEGGDYLTAPMPGRIVSVHAAQGDHVTSGTVILVLEAMKVQIRLSAPRDTTIAFIQAQQGDLVDEGTELVRFQDPQQTRQPQQP
jgi:3-methylcrotonyl-CoA carboxylase alpha subunit